MTNGTYCVVNPQNPTEIVEEILLNQEWTYQRLSPCEIAAEVEARWGIYRLQFYWQEEYDIFHLTCFMDLRVTGKEANEFYKLLALLNERVLMGHFELFSTDGIPAYRHSFMLPSSQSTQSELIEHSIALSLEETDRFYPAFQLVIAGEKSAKEAASIAILDTAGEA